MTIKSGDNINSPINVAIPSDMAIGTDASKQISKIKRTMIPKIEPSLLFHYFLIYISFINIFDT